MIAVLVITAFYSTISNNVVKTPSAQNSIEADFVFDQKVFELNGRNIIIFSKPDNYMIEFNRPRIPLYSKEVELPENASLERVVLEGSEMKTYENAEIEFTPADIHFVPENDLLMGFYPEQILWHNVFETLDGRKTVEIIAAPLQYNNQTRQARVYSGMKISVFYK